MVSGVWSGIYQLLLNVLEFSVDAFLETCVLESRTAVYLCVYNVFWLDNPDGKRN